MRRRFFTFGGAMPTFFLGSAPHPVNFLFLRGAAPNLLKESGAKNLILLIKQISYVCVKDIK